MLRCPSEPFSAGAVEAPVGGEELEDSTLPRSLTRTALEKPMVTSNKKPAVSIR